MPTGLTSTQAKMTKSATDKQNPNSPKTDQSSTATTINKANNNNEEIDSGAASYNGPYENRLSVDSIVEALRIKLESGHGECIYQLSDPCKCDLY